MELSEAGALVAAVAARERDVPARVWAYCQVMQALQAGTLKPGERLPSARALALAWRLSRGAIDEAYAQLVDDGLVQRHVGHGSFVVDPLPALANAAAAAPLVAVHGVRSHDHALKPPSLLSPLATDIGSFPLASWRRHLAQALRDGQPDTLSYGMPAGLHALREATAQHLRLTRSIDCTAQQVVIVNSALHAIDLIAQVLFEPGESVCVEDPGFPDEAHLLKQANLQVIDVPVDGQGLKVEALQERGGGATGLLLHPLNQYPTGWRTSAERRRALLAWADANDAWVIEGDHLSEIVADGAAPPALWRSDRAERVLYIGSFNGVMFPALRLAYLVVPQPLIAAFTAMRGVMGDHSPTATQMAMASFIEAGQLNSHVRHLRALYARRRQAFVQAAQQHLAPWAQLGPTSAGVHASLLLSSGGREGGELALVAALARRGQRVQSLSTLGRGGAASQGLVLGYGGTQEADIDAAMQSLGQALREQHAGPW